MRDEIQLTVIATGFDRPQKDAGLCQHGLRQRPPAHQPAHRSNGREPASSRWTYNVRTFDRDDLDIPAFLRRQRATNGR